MIKYLLKLNYVLSCWFSKDKKTIIPGTIHLFLTNIMYLAIMVLFILNAFIPIIIETKILVAIFIVVSLLIMTAFRGSVERMISNEKLKSIIENYSKKEIYEKRFIGLFFIIIGFVLMFVIGIYSSSYKYGYDIIPKKSQIESLNN